MVQMNLSLQDGMGTIVSYFDQFPEWNGIQFEFRGSDGYVNITSLNKALGKRFSDWRRNNFAQELLDELSLIYNIPIDWVTDSADPRSRLTPLVDYIRGNEGVMHVHPAVALSYCMSNPRLQARVNAWIINMLTTGTPTPHYKDWTAMEYLRGVEFNRDDIRDMYGN